MPYAGERHCRRAGLLSNSLKWVAITGAPVADDPQNIHVVLVSEEGVTVSAHPRVETDLKGTGICSVRSW